MLHVPKTAGRSLRAWLDACRARSEENASAPWPIVHHDEAFRYRDAPRSAEARAVLGAVRAPDERFISSFWFARRGGDARAGLPRAHPLRRFESLGELIDALREAPPTPPRARGGAPAADDAAAERAMRALPRAAAAWEAVRRGPQTNAYDHATLPHKVWRAQAWWFDEARSGAGAAGERVGEVAGELGTRPPLYHVRKRSLAEHQWPRARAAWIGEKAAAWIFRREKNEQGHRT